MAPVEWAFYRGEYRGSAIPNEDFPTAEAQARELVSAFCRLPRGWEPPSGADDERLRLVRMAVCAAADDLYLYGSDFLSGDEVSYTVGRISVKGGRRHVLPPRAAAFLSAAGLPAGHLEVAP